LLDASADEPDEHRPRLDGFGRRAVDGNALAARRQGIPPFRAGFCPGLNAPPRDGSAVAISIKIVPSG
jgi:hypothetical protein